MPSTTPDLRTVTGGGSSLRAAGGWLSGATVSALASVNVDGVRPLRRGSGGASGDLERSDFGQASSNVTGGASPGSGGGGAAGGRSSTEGSGVRAWARSRSFRDDEENSRLRRGLTAGAASTGSGADGPRSRAAASCQGAEDGAGNSAWSTSSTDGRSRL